MHITDIQQTSARFGNENVVVNGLNEISDMLNDPIYAEQFVSSGQITNILDNVQEYVILLL